jgi:hypothetical protein
VPVQLADGDALHLARTLRSGQTFRWTSEVAEGGTTVAGGVVGPYIFRVRQDDRGLWLLAPETQDAQAHLCRYLGLVP